MRVETIGEKSVNEWLKWDFKLDNVIVPFYTYSQLLNQKIQRFSSQPILMYHLKTFFSDIQIKNVDLLFYILIYKCKAPGIAVWLI